MQSQRKQHNSLTVLSTDLARMGSHKESTAATSKETSPLNEKGRRAKRQAETRSALCNVLTIFMQSNCSRYSWSGPIFGALRNRDYARLYRLAEALTETQYESAAEHLAANQLAALVVKYPWDFREIGVPHPRKTALEKFTAAEERCRVSNKRLSHARVRRSRYFGLIAKMQADIDLLLGPSPDLPEIYAKCSFSSGANIGVHGNATNLYRKLHAESWTVGSCALPYAVAAICSNEQLLLRVNLGEEEIRQHWFEGGAKAVSVSTNPSDWRRKLHKVDCNKLSFVPKTAKTHRAIAVEPILNSLVQSGIDSVLRDRLRRHWAIDLSDQSRNAYLARVGSVRGELATLDLSSASDSLSIGLCSLLLPSDWFGLLASTRSPGYELSGVKHRYHKFVSMGNGFCFPLETIIFAAAVRAVRKDCIDRRYAVYGDDIIVPTAVYDDVVRLLKFLGFKPNSDKSFAQGPFRESCGADWYRGRDVRPVYLDFHLNCESSLMVFHNATRRSEDVSYLFAEVRPFLRQLVDPVKRFVRPYSQRWARWPSGLTHLELVAINGAFDVASDVFMASRFARWNKDEQRWSWKEWGFVPVSDSDPRNSASFYDAGYLKALTSGEASLSLRYSTKRITIKR